MKHFFTLMALLLTSLAFGQESCPNVYDYNDNNTIDIEDFLGILGLFADDDTDDDGIWDSQDACTDLEACNYANEPSEPCAYFDAVGACGGGCEGDGDGDGICDDEDDCIGIEDECGVCNGPGPTEVVIDEITILYDSVYAEQIDQWFVFEVGADTTFDLICSPPPGCGSLFISEAAEGSLNNRYFELYNPTDSTIFLDEYAFGHCSNGCDNWGYNPSTITDSLDYWINFPAGDQLAPGGTYIVAHHNADPIILAAANMTTPHSSNGDDAFFLTNIAGGDTTVVDAVGGFGPDPGIGFDVAGVPSGTDEHTLVRKAFVQSGNEGDWASSAGTTAEDSEWIVLGQDDWTNLGMHEIEECDTFVSQDCGDPVSYQGYDYATVLIGEQCWFAENLRSENYENGDAIPSGLGDSEWYNTSSGAVAVFGEGNSDCYHASPDGDACDEAWSLSEYGRLYNWYAVDDARGLCPSGWHVPTDGEWTVLTDHLGGESVAGVQMKTTYGWSGGSNGTNSSGFSGLPGGDRYSDGYLNAGIAGRWWSSSPYGSNAWMRYLYINFESVDRSSISPRIGLSVRCIQDAE